MDREEWLAWRRQGIGASDVAAVIGLSPWQSPYSLWAEKAGLIEPEADNDAMRHGRYAEHAIAAWWNDNHTLQAAHPQTWCVHPEHSWARATPDGALVEHGDQTFDDAPALVEYKVADFKAWDDEIPLHYAAQGLWQMGVTGKESVVFAVMHGKRFAEYELVRNDDDIAWLFQQAEAFWNNHVLAGVPPDIDGHPATSAALGARWRARQDSVIELGPALAGTLDQLAKCKTEQAWYELRRAHLENLVKAALGEHTVGTIGGKVAVTWRPQTRRTLDAKAIRARYPRATVRYTTASESRVFLTK